MQSKIPSITIWNSGRADRQILPQAALSRISRKSNTERKSKRSRTRTDGMRRIRSKSSGSNFCVKQIFLRCGNTREIVQARC